MPRIAPALFGFALAALSVVYLVDSPEEAEAATTVTLVSDRSSWRYRNVEGAWPSGWTTPSYDDSSWPQGQAPIGWGSSTIVTSIAPPAGTKPPLSAQFRKSFTINDVAALSNVVLTTRADDGVAVWVNGTEVGRQNLPTGSLSAGTYATAAPSTTSAISSPYRVTIPTSLLKTGTNVIAAARQLNYRATKSASFDASISATQGTTTGTPPTVCGAQGKYAPACGALWGVYTLQRGSTETAVTNLESLVGRKFDITQRYHDFSSTPVQGTFPDAAERNLAAGGRLPFIAWQARVSSSNTSLKYADIASGRYDAAYVVTAADRVKAYGKPIFISFEPEFDTQKSRGTPAQYVAAYRHIHDVFRSKGVTNVAWVWQTSGYLGAGNDAYIWSGYPGDAYVDWVGWDPYNFYRCNNSAWKPFERAVQGTYDWLVSKGLGDKPFLLGEYGTQYDPGNPTLSTGWHRDIPAVAKKYPNLKAMMRFDANGFFGSNTCNLYIDNGPGMLSSFAAAGKDPYLNTR